MASTRTYDATTVLSLLPSYALSGDGGGGEAVRVVHTINWDAAGGTAPTISGWVYGATVTIAAGDWEMAHASDPFQAMGDATYSPGFTVASSRLKLLYIRNTGLTNSITISRTAVTGLPIFDAAGDAVTLAPGDVFLFYKKAGTAALTNDSNDHLTLAASAGSPTCEVLAIYGA